MTIHTTTPAVIPPSPSDNHGESRLPWGVTNHLGQDYWIIWGKWGIAERRASIHTTGQGYKQGVIHRLMSYHCFHYNDIIMGAIASQLTSLTIVYSIVYSDTDQRKHQSSASLALVQGIHRGPVTSPHKWLITWKMFPFDDVIMFDVPCWCCGWNIMKNKVKIMAADVQVFFITK